MRNEHPNVDIVRAPLHRGEIVRNALPVPGAPLFGDGAGNVLDALHQLDERLTILRPAGRKPDAAVADDDGRDAMIGRRCDSIRPDQLAVIMGVDIDKTRGDQQPLGLYLLRTTALDLA